jgi:hypothetical protein
MLDITIRINAIIAYLFLGPIILLAKKDTPLGDSFVRWHAKRASIIILIGIIAFFCYRFMHSFLVFWVFGVTFDVIVLTLIVSWTFLALIAWAYQAYNGVLANEFSLKSFSLPNSTTHEWDYSDESKIRIIASFIPLFWIIVANLYPMNETLIWRKIGSLVTFLLLTSILFFSGTTSTLTLIITVIYIWLLVVTTVQLFGFSRFFRFEFYDKIPSYLELDAHFKASIITILDFCRIAFGKEKNSDYQTRYSRYLAMNMRTENAETSYFMPKWLIAIPFVNLITIPSLRQPKYREYLPFILQWLLITLLMSSIIYFYWLESQMGLYLLFPIITLIMESKENILARGPLTSFVVDLCILFSMSQSKIAEIKMKWEEKASFTYETKIDNGEEQTKNS